MLDFSSFLDLPLIWSLIIAAAIFFYVLLDGFDLGCGIIFPFAPSDKCRNRIMNSIAPFWDGNETWLVMGGGGLFAAFPLAYSVIMPALYLPVIIMLLGLILRGVSFEFRFKADSKYRKIWDVTFHVGSLVAALMQGIILGNFVQGFEVNDRSYAGGALDWANGFAILTGIALVFGYALLGSTWLILKTEDRTQKWARKTAIYIMPYIAVFMLMVSIAMIFVEPSIAELWFSTPNIFYLIPIPVLTVLVFVILWVSLVKGNETKPFMLSIILFAAGYIGIGISLFPWIVPFKFSIWDAAAVSTSQSLLLIGTLLFLPLILAYTAYCYSVFRGKVGHEHMY